MRKTFWFILLAIIFSGTAYGEQNSPAQGSELILYQLDIDNYHLFQDGKIPVDPSWSIQKKLRALLDKISRRHFPDRPSIEILKTEKTKDGVVVTINLMEEEKDFNQSKWYQSFQGSTGGWWTYFQLVYTPLQPGFPGFWFVGIKVFWNGKAIAELDHIDLSGVKSRSKIKKICSVGDKCG